jgi:hypothetical protein
MRPEDFKLNTDYISLATASNFSTTIYFPGTTTSSVYNYSTDLTAPNVNQAYCEYVFTMDGVNWILDNNYGFYKDNFLCVISFERPTSKIIRAKLSAVPIASGAQTLSPITVQLKEAAIYAPDMN